MRQKIIFINAEKQPFDILSINDVNEINIEGDELFLQDYFSSIF